MNVRKTFSRRQDAVCTLNLRPVSKGLLLWYITSCLTSVQISSVKTMQKRLTLTVHLIPI